MSLYWYNQKPIRGMIERITCEIEKSLLFLESNIKDEHRWLISRLGVKIIFTVTCLPNIKIVYNISLSK